MKIFEFELTRTETTTVRIAAETGEEAESKLEEHGVDSFARDFDSDYDEWEICSYSEDGEIGPEDSTSDLEVDGGVLDGKFYSRGEEFIEAYENWLVEQEQRPPPPDPNQLALPLVDPEEKK